MAVKEKVASKLHLPDLQIKGFRGIDDLAIPRLGRATLLAGKNGVGKTTVLESVEVYAARGRYNAIEEILLRREEYSFESDVEGDTVLRVNELALFSGRSLPSIPLSVGSLSHPSALTIGADQLSENQQISYGLPRGFSGARAITASVAGREASLIGLVDDDDQLVYDYNRGIGIRRRRGIPNQEIDEATPPIPCQFLGPEPIANNRLAQLRDRVALTPDEGRAVDALRLLYGDIVEDVTIVAEDAVSSVPRPSRGRRAIVKLSSEPYPVSLKSLGEGAVRFYGTALALANCKGGFLLIDEVENGIHHSVQADYWRMIIAAAKANDVQVLATTHSKDTVAGFATAAVEDVQSEGLAYRLERTKNGRLRAVDYNEEDLDSAVRHNIEVR